MGEIWNKCYNWFQNVLTIASLVGTKMRFDEVLWFGGYFCLKSTSSWHVLIIQLSLRIVNDMINDKDLLEYTMYYYRQKFPVSNCHFTNVYFILSSTGSCPDYTLSGGNFWIYNFKSLFCESRLYRCNNSEWTIANSDSILAKKNLL